MLTVWLAVLLAPGSLNHTANIIKGFAIAIGIAVAVGFVWVWWVHRQRERRQELNARAKSIWADWLRLAIVHPELADPTLGAINDPLAIARYKSFVAHLLSVADQVLALDQSPAWRETLVRHLGAHRYYVLSEEFRASAHCGCSDEVQALLKRVAGG